MIFCFYSIYYCNSKRSPRFLESPEVTSFGKLNTGAKLFAAAILIDALISLTSLIIGIVGGTSVINISPAAAYSFLGIGCFIILPWILTMSIKDARDITRKIVKANVS